MVAGRAAAGALPPRAAQPLPPPPPLHRLHAGALRALAARVARRPRLALVPPAPFPTARSSGAQVPRAAASAYAFAAGFFPRHHPDGLATSLPDDLTPQTAPLSSSSSALHARQQQQQQRGPGGSAPPLGPSGVGGTRPQAVAISMSPKDQDPLLRFYDACPAYASRKRALRPWLVSAGETRASRGLRILRHGAELAARGE